MGNVDDLYFWHLDIGSTRLSVHDLVVCNLLIVICIAYFDFLSLLFSLLPSSIALCLLITMNLIYGYVLFPLLRYLRFSFGCFHARFQCPLYVFLVAMIIALIVSFFV